MHCARTALVCIENTHNRCGGAVLSLAYMTSLSKWATERVRRATYWQSQPPCQCGLQSLLRSRCERLSLHMPCYKS